MVREYIFGTVEYNGELMMNLKTVGDSHTNLTGFQQVIREFSDCTITDTFVVKEKYRSVDGPDGSAYDWYVIDKHYRDIDKSGPIAEKMDETTALMENALCDQDAAVDGRIAAIEDAVCELDAAINN